MSLSFISNWISLRRRRLGTQCVRCLRRCSCRCVRVNFAFARRWTRQCDDSLLSGWTYLLSNVFLFRLSVHLATVYYAISTDVEAAWLFLRDRQKISPRIFGTISRLLFTSSQTCGLSYFFAFLRRLFFNFIKRFFCD